MPKRVIPLVLIGLIAWPQGIAASDHEVPIAVLHGPRTQRQQGGVSGYQWHPLSPDSSTSPCPTTPLHADVFGTPSDPPIRVRTGRPMFIRFHKEDQPSSADSSHPAAVDISGPRGPIPFTLAPHAPDGQVVAWDAKFKAPQSRSRNYEIFAQVRWVDEDCDSFTQWVAWNFTVKKRTRRG